MAAENLPNHYNYQRLDHYLTKDTNPEEIGNQLDEIMGDLVLYAGKEEAYHQLLTERHNILRDIFWKLEKQDHGNR